MVLEPDIHAFTTAFQVDECPFDPDYGSPGPLGYRFIFNPQSFSGPSTFLFLVCVFQADAWTLPTGLIQWGSDPLNVSPLNYLGTYNSSGDGLGLNTTHSDRSVFSVHIFTGEYDGLGFGLGFLEGWPVYLFDVGGVPSLNFSQTFQRTEHGQVMIRAANLRARDLNDPAAVWRGLLGNVVAQWGTGTQAGASGQPIEIIRPGLPTATSNGFETMLLAEPGLISTYITQQTPVVPYIFDHITGTLAAGDAITTTYAMPDTLWQTLPFSLDFPLSKSVMRILGGASSLSAEGWPLTDIKLQMQDSIGDWHTFVNGLQLAEGIELGEHGFLVQNTDLDAVDVRQTGNIRLLNDTIADLEYVELTITFPDAGNVSLTDTGTSGGFTTVFGSELGAEQTGILGDRGIGGSRVLLPAKSRIVTLHLTSDNPGAINYAWDGSGAITVPAGINATTTPISVNISDNRIWETFWQTPAQWRRLASYTSINGNPDSSVDLGIQIQDNVGTWITLDRTGIGRSIRVAPDATSVAMVHPFDNPVPMRLINLNGLGPYDLEGLAWGFVAVPDISINVDVYETSDSEIGDATGRVRSIYTGRNFAYGDTMDITLGTLGWADQYFPEPCDFYGFTIYAQVINNNAYMSIGNDGISLSVTYDTYSDPVTTIQYMSRPEFDLYSGADDTLLGTITLSELDSGSGIDILVPPWSPNIDPTQGLEWATAIAFIPEGFFDPFGDFVPYLKLTKYWPRVPFVSMPSGYGPHPAYLPPIDYDMNWFLLAFSLNAAPVAARGHGKSWGMILGA